MRVAPGLSGRPAECSLSSRCFDSYLSPRRRQCRLQQQRYTLANSRLALCGDNSGLCNRRVLPTSRRQVCVRAQQDQEKALADNANRGPPSFLVRFASALMYLVPWIDVIGLGRMIYHFFPASILLYCIPGPLVPIYYSTQFAPLIVFFLLFLSVVKNTKLHHFVRFHCMQGIMLDIATMLFTLLRMYAPAEIRWSYLMDIYDMFSWNICMAVVVYCVYFALRGKYADVPFVSESVYLQVDASL